MVVALPGTTVYPTKGESFTIKAAKIRGEVSEGMICAEDEIGVGKSHAGIMVLPADTKVGMPAADYFTLENDVVFEIGLTPNRSDAASHLGVARDLAAVLKTIDSNSTAEAKIIGIRELPPATGLNTVEIKIENTNACKRYSGLVVRGITVSASPDWLQNRLKAIGIASD